MSISNLFQFICGFVLGVLIFTTGAVGIAFAIFTRIATVPPRPEFPSEPSKKPALFERQEAVAPKEVPTPDSASTSSEELEPGAYKARVTWSEGLALRTEPNFEAQKVGGVAYNAELVVLQDSPDKKWQKVRALDGDREGWVKAGNLVKVE